MSAKQKGEFPISFHTEILERVLKPDEMRWLNERYNAGKFQEGRIRYEPTNQEIRLYEKFLKKQTTLKLAADELGQAIAVVRTHFGLIAMRRALEAMDQE